MLNKSSYIISRDLLLKHVSLTCITKSSFKKNICLFKKTRIHTENKKIILSMNKKIEFKLIFKKNIIKH